MVLGILSIINANFFNNTKYITDSGKYVEEYNKFNMFFIEDVKNNTDAYAVQENRIVFEDGTTYEYDNDKNTIYRNAVKICKNIEFCEFTSEEITDDNNFTKNIINVKLKIKGSKTYETENSYVLKYW
jgi:uncharacterized membrane protein